MDKISVVVPTIQKNLKVLNKLLGLLIRDEAVSEIIIINNAQKPFIPYAKIRNSEKLKICNQKENLYVNPSWNLGVSLCSNDKFFITNDDILYCENFCTKVLETGILDKEDTGLAGLATWDINSFKTKEKNIDIPDSSAELQITDMSSKYLYTGNWGSGIFGRKKNYYIIPEELKVIYGYNYLLYKNLENKKINYQIGGVKFNHITSLSSSLSEVTNAVCSDLKNYEQFIPKEGFLKDFVVV